MSTKVKAILIDPTLKSVTEVEYEGNYREIKKLLGIESPIDAREINGTPEQDRETLYFDDEFLLKDEGEPQDYFVLNGVGTPIGGRGLIVGTNEEGETVSTKLTVEAVRANVRFKKLRVNGWLEGYTDEIDHPVFGKTTRIVGAQPKFEEVE